MFPMEAAYELIKYLTGWYAASNLGSALDSSSTFLRRKRVQEQPQLQHLEAHRLDRGYGRLADRRRPGVEPEARRVVDQVRRLRLALGAVRHRGDCHADRASNRGRQEPVVDCSRRVSRDNRNHPQLAGHRFCVQRGQPVADHDPHDRRRPLGGTRFRVDRPTETQIRYSQKERVMFNIKQTMKGVLVVLASALALTMTGCSLSNGPDEGPTGPRDSDGKCLPQFVQTKISDEERYRPIKGGFDADTPEASFDKLLDAFGHSAAYMRQFVLFFQTELRHNVPPLDSLVDDDCLSDEGFALWSTLKTDAESVALLDKPPNGDWYNSGWFEDQLNVAKKAGISGNVKVLEIKLTGDRGTIYILVRCGNPITLKPPPDVPPGPTDECTSNCKPDKPKKPKDKCPNIKGTQTKVPGGYSKVDGKCVKKKSAAKEDYRRPGDGGKGADKGEGEKPKVRVTEPASEPAEVETEKTGGRGVEDSPTKAPGSESGVTAPGAEPAPATSAPPPPEEPGAGQGDVGDPGPPA